MEPTSITRKLGVELEPRVRALLVERGFKLGELPYAFFTAKTPGASVTFYHSGKLVIQGRDVGGILDELSPGALLGTDETIFSEALRHHPGGPAAAWIGSDESGKGDYFGPLVVAGAAVRRDQVPLFQELGVADCKTLSDQKVRELVPGLKAATPQAVVVLMPPRYNALYVEMGSNLNTMLAWAHARVIEDLLEQGAVATLAVVDQFAPEARVRRALMTRGQKISLLQRVRAEDDPAVAIASMLARDTFVSRLRGLSRTWGVDLPKGAGPQVIAAARTFVATHGAEQLGCVAKLHFKTTAGLGLDKTFRTNI